MIEIKIALQRVRTKFSCFKARLHYRDLAPVFRDSKEDSILEFKRKFFVIESKIALQSISTSFL